MSPKHLISFSTFFDVVDDALGKNSDPRKHRTEYKIQVGVLVDKVIVKPRLKISRVALQRHIVDWLSVIKDAFGKNIWNGLSERNWPQEIRNFRNYGSGQVYQAAALHYRLHADLKCAQYIESIDDLVFRDVEELRFRTAVFQPSESVYTYEDGKGLLHLDLFISYLEFREIVKSALETRIDGNEYRQALGGLALRLRAELLQLTVREMNENWTPWLTAGFGGGKLHP